MSVFIETNVAPAVAAGLRDFLRRPVNREAIVKDAVANCEPALFEPEKSAREVRVLVGLMTYELFYNQLGGPSVRFTAGKTQSFVDWISERFRRPPWMLD
jgi:hypothetical protein